MSPDDPRLLLYVLREHFLSFLRKCFGQLNPGEIFLANWHLQAIAWQLERVRRGELRRLIIEVPPRSLKSVSVSVAFPAFLLGHEPNRKLISVSYSQDLAIKHAADCRAVMLSDWYQRLFPHTRLSATKNQEANYETTQRGYRYATSIGGTLTGRGGDILIIDDPIKPEDAMSEARREATNAWYSRTALSRLNNKATNAIIIVQQRLHLNDLAGHVRALDDWTVLTLPAIAEVDERIPIGPGRFYQRRAGEALHPAREPLAVLETLRRSLGSSVFNAQYQQRPVAADGDIVKWHWFPRYDQPPPRQRMAIHQSWDTASKPDEHCDWSVCTTWGVLGDDQLYLLDLHRARHDFPALKRAVLEQASRWKPDHLIIEDKGVGTPLIQQLRAERHPNVPTITPFVPKEDKLTRLHAQSARIEAGEVWLPQRAPWLDGLRAELAAFPQGKHDDQVDSLSQYLTWHFQRWRRRTIVRPLRM